MEDGRLFTNYLTNANLETKISQTNNIKIMKIIENFYKQRK